MDVRIGYAIDLEEVPDKVAEILSKLSTQKAEHLMVLAKQMIDLGHHGVGLSLIDDTRKLLAKVDRGLSDIYMILNGYDSAKQKPDIKQTNDEVGVEGDLNVD